MCCEQRNQFAGPAHGAAILIMALLIALLPGAPESSSAKSAPVADGAARAAPTRVTTFALDAP